MPKPTKKSGGTANTPNAQVVKIAKKMVKKAANEGASETASSVGMRVTAAPRNGNGKGSVRVVKATPISREEFVGNTTGGATTGMLKKKVLTPRQQSTGTVTGSSAGVSATTPRQTKRSGGVAANEKAKRRDPFLEGFNSGTTSQTRRRK